MMRRLKFMVLVLGLVSLAASNERLRAGSQHELPSLRAYATGGIVVFPEKHDGMDRYCKARARAQLDGAARFAISDAKWRDKPLAYEWQSTQYAKDHPDDPEFITVDGVERKLVVLLEDGGGWRMTPESKMWYIDAYNEGWNWAHANADMVDQSRDPFGIMFQLYQACLTEKETGATRSRVVRT